MPTIKPAGYNQYLKNNPNVTGIDLLIADLNGVLRGKRVQPSALQKVFKDGICLPASVSVSYTHLTLPTKRIV